jgi:hypothetical protein
MANGYTDLLANSDVTPSKDYIPVVNEYTSGSSLGAIKAVAGLNTNQGVVQGFDADGNIICLGSGTAGSGNLENASGVYYGIHLEVNLADAQAQGWPGNATDIKWPGHAASAYLYSH